MSETAYSLMIEFWWISLVVYVAVGAVYGGYAAKTFSGSETESMFIGAGWPLVILIRTGMWIAECESECKEKKKRQEFEEMLANRKY